MLENRQGGQADTRIEFLGVPFDRVHKTGVLQQLGAVGIPAQPRYIVTPNVDHIVRLAQNPALKKCYDDAWISLCDSKPVWLLSKFLSKDLDHFAGSDLTDLIFKQIIKPGDVISVVAAYDHVAKGLAERFPEVRFRSHVPPFGVLQNPDALRATVEFLSEEPARFVFIAIGSPQSEVIAREFSRHSNASGVALCIGASLEFITGTQRRAPRLMQMLSLEWLYRLASEPRRLWRRYLLTIVPLARLYLRELRPLVKSND